MNRLSWVSSAKSLARLAQEPEVPGLIPGSRPHTFVSSSACSRSVVSYWRKYVHLVFVNSLEGVSQRQWLGLVAAPT